MSTNIEEVKAHLSELGFKFVEKNGYIGLKITGMPNYTNPEDGKNELFICILVVNNGEVVKLVCPHAYKFSNNASSYNKLALMQTLLQIAYSTNLLQLEYDPDDGEIRVTVDIPIIDSRLTAKQLEFALDCIMHGLDNEHHKIVDAMRHGLTPESDRERLAAWEEFKKERAAKRRSEFGN
jgi:hypothetical protein